MVVDEHFVALLLWRLLIGRTAGSSCTSNLWSLTQPRGVAPCDGLLIPDPRPPLPLPVYCSSPTALHRPCCTKGICSSN
jgi:hypothetical protein